LTYYNSTDWFEKLKPIETKYKGRKHPLTTIILPTYGGSILQLRILMLILNKIVLFYLMHIQIWESLAANEEVLFRIF
jgi:hypothetical protein